MIHVITFADGVEIDVECDGPHDAVVAAVDIRLDRRERITQDDVVGYRVRPATQN